MALLRIAQNVIVSGESGRRCCVIGRYSMNSLCLQPCPSPVRKAPCKTGQSRPLLQLRLTLEPVLVVATRTLALIARPVPQSISRQANRCPLETQLKHTLSHHSNDPSSDSSKPRLRMLQPLPMTSKWMQVLAPDQSQEHGGLSLTPFTGPLRSSVSHSYDPQ